MVLYQNKPTDPITGPLSFFLVFVNVNFTNLHRKNGPKMIAFENKKKLTGGVMVSVVLFLFVLERATKTRKSPKAHRRLFLGKI
jgi:hypothetical protein